MSGEKSSGDARETAAGGATLAAAMAGWSTKTSSSELGPLKNLVSRPEPTLSARARV